MTLSTTLINSCLKRQSKTRVGLEKNGLASSDRPDLPDPIVFSTVFTIYFLLIEEQEPQEKSTKSLIKYLKNIGR